MKFLKAKIGIRLNLAPSIRDNLDLDSNLTEKIEGDNRGFKKFLSILEI
jgi:hypothetical protein